MKIKSVFHIFFVKYDWEEKGMFMPYTFKLADDDTRTFVCDQEIEFEVPDSFDPRLAQIVALEAQKKKAMADYQSTVTMINERISKLQAIEFQP